ncbi:MAG TPA: DUF2330 domain-containing protein [Hyphomicrobiaceae bacterium]|nr:DUF2330 domain-containing protein [Hyphomicrobiaceae bacterium]
MKRLLYATAAVGLAIAAPMDRAEAFCGFYVAKADTKLFNKASKVVVARKGDRTVITMASDYEGAASEFAMVVPVPTVITKGQINITENALVDHLDAYTAPRLVEYFDPDPCNIPRPMAMAPGATAARSADAAAREDRRRSLGVKIEAEYTVGEYDILILSAKESGGLETWLRENDYKPPQGAGPVLASYIKQGMKFFVAKVNLKEKDRLGTKYLRPISVAFESPKFMLPIRLGTVNANGPQDMIMFFLTEKGRVETTNYRTLKLPSDMDVPIFTRNEFGAFYKAMFETQVKKDGMKAVYLEYAWNMAWCDPCAADPLPNDKLVELGAFWLLDGPGAPSGPGVMPRRMRPPGGPANVFVTRLHVRYDAVNFPEDLMFQETADSSNFQGRYVLRHPFTGPATCSAGEAYKRNLQTRFQKEAATLANLTGWDIAMIREKMAKAGQPMSAPPIPGGDDDAWYKKMWPGRSSP